jgi:ABC-type branched-subunit amino acid transport system substrate-binding protein
MLGAPRCSMLIVLGGFTALSGVAVTSSSADAPPASSPFCIGLLLPPEEPDAASLRQGVRLGVDHANATPGVKVELLIRGRMGQWGADGEEAGRMVIDDAVRGLIAPPGGAPSHLALQVSGRTATPVISLCPDSSVTRAGIPWMVCLAPGTSNEARLIFTAFKTAKYRRLTHWGALVPEERAGRETAKDLRKSAEAAGCRLDNPVPVPSGLSDFAAVLKSVLATKPEGILLWHDPIIAGRLAKSLRTAGYAGQVAGPDRLQNPDFVWAAGDAAQGVMCPQPVLDRASQIIHDRFAADYHRRFASAPTLTASLAYDAAQLLIDVLRAAGEQPAYRAFPLRHEQPGASGSLNFDPAGNRIVPLELVVFQSGHFARFISESNSP